MPSLSSYRFAISDYLKVKSLATFACGCNCSVMPNFEQIAFSLSLHVSCLNLECKKCKPSSETSAYGPVNSAITLKDGNKGTRIICCHRPILINNSILDCAVSPVRIGICLKETMAQRLQRTAFQCSWPKQYKLKYVGEKRHARIKHNLLKNAILQMKVIQ